ncbi:type IV pilin [Methanocorpusculum vombati]|uniref:Type IV pilin n=1 Tax=Methanocorpusculum vombati TaxID=3002864 RepID=A0ABT4IN19_9EURY|nr:type IV pilin [Methanocorpusculum vombati]MCZ9319762.1 type IV pilin [Methanocorpusculum sp.]MCZ0863147.1 type IV pilin [Methanocorpusculum vombati]MDE2520256.1 type IV pilin [Methanocorpusculum sp.]MDE2533850.1 type IV pilin [Methanocorpusculum sp.]MDE2545892.1 type IV pilin [Methanocorpusculum sp.]
MRSPPSHDAAVSPAIGTILLVALTVVFVAVAAVVAMGLADGMFNMKQVGLTLKPYAFSGDSPEHGIGFIVHGGADAGDLVSLSAVITGPELTYAKTKNNSVEGPQVGQEYRMAAYVDPAVLDKIKKGSYTVDLTTTGKDSAAEIECYATVTGKFRDGTEQVLLIQKVTIPAIPGIDGSMSDPNGWISVVPYYINDIYPGHGFMITILDDSVTGLGTPTFTATSPKSQTITTSNMTASNPSTPGKKQYTYDLSPPNGDDWLKTPYPNTQPSSNLWVLGAVTGNVTVNVQVDDKTHSVTVGPITIPPRMNIFENTSKVAGKLTKTGLNNITITFEPKTTLKDHTPDFIVYYSGDTQNSVYSANIINDLKGSVEFTPSSPLTAHPKERLEAFVLVQVGGTQVWYKVASEPVSKFL